MIARAAQRAAADIHRNVLPDAHRAATIAADHKVRPHALVVEHTRRTVDRARARRAFDGVNDKLVDGALMTRKAGAAAAIATRDGKAAGARQPRSASRRFRSTA